MWCRPLEWNLNGTTDPRDGSVDHLSLNSLKDRHGPIRAPKSEAARLEAGVASVADDGDPVEIDGDATLLRRLIRNLLENAMRHGRPPIRIAVKPRQGRAQIAVSDCGVGIAPAERERVFEPF